MTLTLDHIFVCTAVGAPEVQALLEAGFVEGSRNVHPGQGTTNRRFFFAHGFLEFLWVHDATEATSPLTGPTRLWERWSQRGGLSLPFGICFSSPSEADHPLPFASWAYEPAYLPKGKCIRFAEGASLSEPELFALSWPQSPTTAAPQPREHRLPLGAMRSVSVGLPDVANLSAPMRAASEAGLLGVHASASPELVVTFDSPEPIDFALPSLALKLSGRPVAV